MWCDFRSVGAFIMKEDAQEVLRQSFTRRCSTFTGSKEMSKGERGNFAGWTDRKTFIQSSNSLLLLIWLLTRVPGVSVSLFSDTLSHSVRRGLILTVCLRSLSQGLGFGFVLIINYQRCSECAMRSLLLQTGISDQDHYESVCLLLYSLVSKSKNTRDTY